MPRSKRNRALPEHLTLAILLVGFALLCQQQGWLWRWDNNIHDSLLRFWSRPAPAEIIIVAIDEDSLARYGRWPWSRGLHAELLDRISGEQPRAVAFDVIFAEADHADPEGDRRFAQAIRDSGRVALPVHMEQPRPGASPLEVLPAPSLGQTAAALGHVHVELDPDGIARRLYLREGLGEPRWPHLGLALLQVAGQVPGPPPGSAAPGSPPSMMVWARAQPMLIPFAGPPGHFQQISFAQVLQGNYAPGTFVDRYVLVGATATGMGDALPTPVSGFSHSMSGVEINANVLAALLDGIHIAPLAGGWQLALAGTLALLPLLLFPHMAPRTNLLVTAGLLAATIALAGALLIGAHRWFPPAAALLAIALSYPLWNWRRLELAMRYLNQELDRLKEQQAPMAARQASSLEAGLDFLQHVLPVDGWCLRGPGGSLISQRGQVPRPPAEAMRAGAWQASAGALWTRLEYHGREQDLGLHWRGNEAPDDRQAALLGQVLEQFSDPAPVTEAGGHEVVRDRIRQVQQAAAELRELRRLVEDSLSNMADGILATNALGEIVLSNTRAGWYLRGDDDADLGGQPVMTLLGDLQIRGDGNWEDLLRCSLLENARNQVETRHADGRQLLVQIAPLSRDRQQPGGLVLNFSDITPLKASETKRTELLNFLSHDLRSPLVSIVALLELAREKDGAGAIRDLLARMETHAGKTLDLADQFLQLARIESGGELTLRDLDLAGVAMNAVEQVWEHARVKRIRIEKSIAREDAWIHGEGSLLERALVNLLGNAIKYSEPGSTVRLELNARGGEWRCCVVDEGEGIPQAEIPRLFDRFQRIYRKNRPAQSGAGLGLAFVQAVAGIHGGRVDVESREGEGSRFCLVLPRQER